MITGNFDKMSNSKNGNYWKYSIVLAIILISILIGWVYLATNWSWIEIAKDNNSIGDAIGGITNPIIGIGGIILTFIAFYVQYQFNKEQSARIDFETTERLNEKKETEILNNFNFLLSEFTRLESKVFEISKIHLEFNYLFTSDSFDSNEFDYNLNKINYIIVNYNSLIRISRISKIESFSRENRYINTYDEIILNNLERLYSKVLFDTLNKVDYYLRAMKLNNLISETDHIIEFNKQHMLLKLYIKKISEILFNSYPNFGHI